MEIDKSMSMREAVDALMEATGCDVVKVKNGGKFYVLIPIWR